MPTVRQSLKAHNSKLAPFSKAAVAAASSSSQLVSSRDENKKRYLPAGFKPSATDVVCGKGKECFNHPGNKRFRDVIDANLNRYQSASNKMEKSAIVNEIVDLIRKDCSYNGGFVRPETYSSRWFEIGDDAAREKVGQVIRDAMLKQNPDGLEIKQRKRKARAEERKGKRVIEERYPGRAQPPILFQLPSKPIVVPLPSKLSLAPQKVNKPAKSIVSSTTMRPTPVPHIPPIQKFMFPPSFHRPVNVFSAPEIRPIAVKKMNVKTRKKVKLTDAMESTNEPSDFYERLRSLYRRSDVDEETENTTVSTYSGRDTGDEMTSNDSDDENGDFVEEDINKLVYV
jgi:hypothetical protein